MNELYKFGELCASDRPERLMDISRLSEEVDTFVFDCDGVIWYTERQLMSLCAILVMRTWFIFVGKRMN